jgi:DNA polymerase I-like protein with 3'-5' exonuclease and polymerase domains
LHPIPVKVPVPNCYITEASRVIEAVEHVVTADVVGVDIETTGLDAFKDNVRLLQVADQTGKAYILDADRVDITPVVKALKDVRVVLAHNMKFEASFLMPYGFKLGTNTYCTQLLYQILTAGEMVESSLKSVAKKLLGVELDKTEQTSDWSGDVTPEMIEYAATDARILPPLYEELMRRLEKAGDLDQTIELEMQTLKPTVEMARSGLPATEEKLKDYIEESRESIHTLVAEMDTYITADIPEEFAERNRKNKAISESRNAAVNWQSAEQIAWGFSTLGIKLPLTKKGRPSTSETALEAVDHPLAENVLALNKLKTIPTKWTNALEYRLHNGRLFADWKQIGAASGRYSCAKPPLQGIPKAGKARDCFEAPSGYKFVSSDLSQIEVRIWAAISEDETLIADFDRDDLDLYRSVGERLFGRGVTEKERSAMKAVVLGRIYGMGARTMQDRLQRALGRPVPEKEVRGYIAELESAYPAAEAWRKRQETKDPDATTTTRTMAGRLRRKVTSNPQRFNTPIQGTAADVMKTIAVAVVDEIVEGTPEVELSALIHDEVVLLAPADTAQGVADILKAVMERVGDDVVNGGRPQELRVPILADTSVLHSLGNKH